MRTCLLLFVSCLCLLLSGCSKDKKQTAAEGKSAAKRSAAKRPGSKPARTRPTSPDAGEPVQVHQPLEHQPSHKMLGLKFLGWTRSGDRFVLETDHELLFDEWQFHRFQLKQVHDALTHKLVDAYRIKLSRRRMSDDERPWKKVKLWEQAKPREAWAGFLAQNPLTATEPSNRSADKRWSLSAAQLGRAPGPTRLEFKRSDRGLDFGWYGITNESEEFRDSPSPRATVWVEGKTRHRALEFQLAQDIAMICGVDPEEKAKKSGKRPGFVGEVLGHWSPRGDRVVLSIDSKDQLLCIWPNSGGASGEDTARFYVRTAGPQLRLIAPPAAEVPARRLARKLAAGGFPVTQLQLDGKPRDKTLIYHRGDDGAALAGRLAKLIPGSTETKALKKRGWLRLIVVLGGP